MIDYEVWNERFEKLRGRWKINLDVEDGISGNAEIDTFHITPEIERAEHIRGLFNGHGRYVPVGNYKRLSVDGWVMMSNTPDEIRDHWPLFKYAEGHVLINGLGLGVCLKQILEYPEVTKVTVVEINPHVIKLVEPYYKDSRVEIVNESAFDYKPPKGVRYGAVWHDIWQSIDLDNWPEYGKLHRKYGRLTDWQGSWARPLLEKVLREERNRLDYCNILRML